MPPFPGQRRFPPAGAVQHRAAGPQGFPLRRFSRQQGPDAAFRNLLRTKVAHELLDASYELCRLMANLSNGTQAFETVVRAAVRVGILRDE